MLNIQGALLGGILIAIIGIPIDPALAHPVSTTPVLAQQPPQRARVPSTSTETAIDAFVQTFNRRRTRSPGLSRSGGFCPIAPGLVETDRVWSDRPLFLWQGSVEQIQLRTLGSPEVLWSQTLDPQQRSIVYSSGTALQPGQIYQWELLGQSNANASFVFQVMEPDQRAPIAARLQEIEAQSSADGANKEVIAIQQAQYFADQSLWSDALQVLYSIGEPSPAIAQAIQTIETSLCSGQLQQSTAPENQRR